jgi:hypothetical protein
MNLDDLAAAVAFFQSTDDVELLKSELRRIRPLAARAVSGFERSGKDAPQPLDVAPAAQPASRDAALRTARQVKDFGELQALSRAIGRRIEQLAAQ